MSSIELLNILPLTNHAPIRPMIIVKESVILSICQFHIGDKPTSIAFINDS